MVNVSLISIYKLHKQHSVNHLSIFFILSHWTHLCRVFFVTDFYHLEKITKYFLDIKVPLKNFTSFLCWNDLSWLFSLEVSASVETKLSTELSYIFPGRFVWTTAWKVSKYGVFFSPCFPAFGLNTEIYGVFSPNAGKYGPEKTPYLVTFHAGNLLSNC